jgi:hypothetical protein
VEVYVSIDQRSIKVEQRAVGACKQRVHRFHYTFAKEGGSRNVLLDPPVQDTTPSSPA